MKRIVDTLVSALLLLITSPIWLTAALLVSISMGRPILFKQVRVGKDEELFNIYKFRTMNEEVDNKGRLLMDEQRLTKLGGFLRSYSIDELPQLVNIIKGDMSLVGPRPLLPRYLPYYTEKEQIRHSVRPGITGLAQINGRNTIGWNQRLAFDSFYVENYSMGLDLKILFQTVKMIGNKKDIQVVTTIQMVDLDQERKEKSVLQEG
ncbi:sugar transferase [Bacillus sp. 2205SS5-2]|uniref:sugar transferase n=1 Tax=Bacillus sp. 2205SS5-2 TaxID=3109031 RepID=UPI003003F7AD